MSKQLKLGLSLGYWGAGKPDHSEAVAEAERLGFDSVWTAESWGAEGPKNIALAAEIADGWLPIFYAPKHEGMYRDFLNEGFARPGARRTAADFEVLTGAPVIVTDDVEAAADLIRPGIALYIGGMG